MEKQYRYDGNLSSRCRPKRGPQRLRSPIGKHPRSDHDADRRGDRQLETNVSGQLAAQEQEHTNRNADRNPRIHDDAACSRTEHGCRHDGRPQHRRLPAGGDHEDPQPDDAHDEATHRSNAHDSGENPPCGEEEGNVAPGYRDEVSEARAA